MTLVDQCEPYDPGRDEGALTYRNPSLFRRWPAAEKLREALDF